MRTIALAVLLVGVAPRVVHADEHADGTLVYAELLGKGGPWGLGVEHGITPHIALGTVASFVPIRGQQLFTFAPYVHFKLKRWLYSDVGASIVHSRIPSPVASWNGTSDTGAGGIVTLGFERARERLVLRGYGAVEVGEGGVAPWLGLAAGVRL